MDRPMLIFDAWLLALTGVAAVTDARSGTIPNWLTLPSLALSLAAHALLGGPGALVRSMLGIVVCGLVPLLLFWRGAMGGGDVKLFAAAGALGGASTGLALQLLTYVLAGLAACVRLAYARQFGTVLRRTAALATRELRGGARADRDPSEGVSVRLGVPALLSCVMLVLERARELAP